MKSRLMTVIALAIILMPSLFMSNAGAESTYLSGHVANKKGKPISGVIITAFNSGRSSSISVYSQTDGSYHIKGLPSGTDSIRARQIGMGDVTHSIEPSSGSTIDFVMKKVKGIALKMQMRAVDRLDLLKFDNEKDSLNFKMMCTYCHLVGTEGFRTPETPVDWKTMVTRMDGFSGLYPHTQRTLVEKMVKTYGKGAERKWPKFKPPPPAMGEALKATISEWTMGPKDAVMIHDLEPGSDDLMYAVDMSNDFVMSLDPETAERKTYLIPGGKRRGVPGYARKGPHSIERSKNGDMWLTLALSGQMAKFVPSTGEYKVVSGAPAPRPRGAYPHTLRVDQKGIVWFTDAGTNSVLSIHPDTYVVKEYRLLSAGQVQGGGRGGESRGIVPYGIDIAPDGKVWYSKLNGQRIGRIDPKAKDGSPEQIKEWKPPVYGPRRLHVAADGIVWVPGWASGNFAKFNPKTEEWKVYELPHGSNSLTYALNIHPKTGDIWICGTGWNSMVRFDPKTEKMTVYPMPTRVTYTREVEFDKDGNIWVCNSNSPARHIENHHGSLIKIVPGGE